MDLREEALNKVEGSQAAPLQSRIAGAPSIWGIVGDYPYWNAVVRLYDEDKLDGAMQLAQTLGDGRNAGGVYLFRLIEAEDSLRKGGLSRELSKSLTIEYVPGEQEHRIDWLTQTALNILEQIRLRLGWQLEEKIWLSILPEEFDFIFASNRFGYCAQKTDFYKICLPAHAATSPEQYNHTFAHELAHVVSLSVTKQRLSHWLGEGFSVFASGENDGRSCLAFLNQPQLWLEPRQLELQFGPGVDLGSAAKWFAYQQAGWIVRYAASVKGIPGLMAMLGEHADESFFKNLKLLALGGSQTAEAIKKVYGMDEANLFANARKFLASGPS